MSNTFDQFHDPSFKVLAERLQEAPGYRDLIKTASLDLDEHNSLPSSAFAWEEKRLFPIHTADQAALSHMYATAKHASVPEHVMRTLDGALKVYGLQAPKTEVREVKVAADNEADYLLPELKRWKVTEPAHVKLAEEALATYARELSPAQRSTAAVRLVKKAQALGVKVSHIVERHAGLQVSDLDTVRDWVEVRANLAKDAGHRQAYTKIAQALSGAEGMSQDRDALVKLASVIDELDQKSGINKLYGRRMPDPMETVFNTDKVAEAMLDLGGKAVPLAKLASLPTSVYGDIFGSDVIPEITTGSNIDTQKLATVLETMPLDLKRMLAKQMGSYL